MRTRVLSNILLAVFALMVLTRTAAAVEKPRLIKMVGAGVGGFQRIAAWLADNLTKQRQDLSVWFDYYDSGRDFRDGVLLLQDRKADICLVNSHTVAAMAMRGRGLFQKPFRELRAIATFSQYDWCLFAVDAGLGVHSLADLKNKRVPLKLATGYLDDGIAFLAMEVLRRHGITREELQQWGSQFIEGTPPMTVDALSTGKADTVFQEGAFLEGWKEAARKRPLSFLSISPDVAKEFKDELGVESFTVPAQYYPGQDQPFLALDFSDFILCVREDMDEELAYQLTRIVVETRAETESDTSVSSTRVDPAKAAKTSPVPLHPGAERYYREKRLL